MKKKLSVSINKKIEKFNKKIKIPGDKSCSIRTVLFASQCIGISKIKNLLESEDVLNCINTLKTSLGVKIIKKNNIYQVYGNGLNSFKVKKILFAQEFFVYVYFIWIGLALGRLKCMAILNLVFIRTPLFIWPGYFNSFTMRFASSSQP